MSRTSLALIHLRPAKAQNDPATQLGLREQVIDYFKRLIPSSNIPPNILTGAKAVFSIEAISHASMSTLKNMKQFFRCLEALGVRSKNDFIELPITGLEDNPKDRPESTHADRARYILENVFKCKFAYDQRGQLIIGTIDEIKAGKDRGEYSYVRKPHSSTIPVFSRPIITGYQAIPSRSTALVKRQEIQAIAKRELRLKAELKQAVIELLESGQPELAATVLFSSPERSVYENLALVDEIAKERSLFMFDGYEYLPAAIRLQKDLEDTGLIETKKHDRVILLAYLLGRYASVAPVLAAKVIDKIGTNWLGMSKDIDHIVDIFAFMEKDEYRANAIQGLTALGSFKLVDRIIQTGLDECHALYHDRFGGTLDILKGRDGDLFLNHAEYKNRSVYRKKPEEVEIKYYSNGESGLKVNDFQDVAGHKQKMVMAMSPDAHLRTTIRELLRKGQDGLAARVAFSGYYDIAVRFENLTKLGFQNMGRLLGAMGEDKRIKIFIELAFGLEGEKQQKSGEEVALAMLWLGGEKNLEKAAAYYQQLVIAEAGFPGARFAARKFMLIGSFAHHLSADYGLLYDQLYKENPEIYEYDWHNFVKTDGCLSKIDAPLGKRKALISHYYEVFDNESESQENRIMAINMLGILGAHECLGRNEYLEGLLRKILHYKYEPISPLTNAFFWAMAIIYSKMDPRNSDERRLMRKLDSLLINSNRPEKRWFQRKILKLVRQKSSDEASRIITLLRGLLLGMAYKQKMDRKEIADTEEDRLAIIDTASAIGEPALPVLEMALWDISIPLRKAAAEAMLRIKEKNGSISHDEKIRLASYIYFADRDGTKLKERCGVDIPLGSSQSSLDSINADVRERKYVLKALLNIWVKRHVQEGRSKWLNSALFIIDRGFREMATKLKMGEIRAIPWQCIALLLSVIEKEEQEVSEWTEPDYYDGHPVGGGEWQYSTEYIYWDQIVKIAKNILKAHEANREKILVTLEYLNYELFCALTKGR